MKNKLLLYFLLGLFIIYMSACSDKWYAKQCSKRFPVTESIHDTVTQTIGKTDTFMQFVTFDCDSAIKYFHDTISLTHSFKVPCPPSYSRVDTFKITTTIVKKDSDSNYLSQLELSKLREKTITQAEKISKQSREFKKEKTFSIIVFYLFL